MRDRDEGCQLTCLGVGSLNCYLYGANNRWNLLQCNQHLAERHTTIRELILILESRPRLGCPYQNNNMNAVMNDFKSSKGPH